jgi:outer membrane protein assembly factor BamA
VVQDIRIEGLQRVEPGTVFAYLPIKQGDTFTDDKASEAIRALYATGFFNDVRIATKAASWSCRCRSVRRSRRSTSPASRNSTRTT